MRCGRLLYVCAATNKGCVEQQKSRSYESHSFKSFWFYAHYAICAEKPNQLILEVVFFLSNVAEHELAVHVFLCCDKSGLRQFFVVARNLDLLAVF